MTPTMILVAVVAALSGGAVGYFKLANPLLGVVLGAGLGVGVAFVFFQEPPLVMAVEDMADLDDVLNNAETPVVLDFYSDRCPPCRELAPVLEKIAEEYRGRLKFVKIDCQESPALPHAYQVRAIPMIIVFVKGEEKVRLPGFNRPDVYRMAFDAILKKAATGA